MTPLQLQQLKYQQQQQQQKLLQTNQHQQQIQQIKQTPPQILISGNQFVIQPQQQQQQQQQHQQANYQTIATAQGAAKIVQHTTQRVGGLQQQQQQQTNLITQQHQPIGKVSVMPHQFAQVQSPQQQQQQQHQQQQIKVSNSPQSAAMSPMNINAPSPVKHDTQQQHHYIQQSQQLPTPSPKTITKMIKSEVSDLQQTIHAVSKQGVGEDYERDELVGGDQMQTTEKKTIATTMPQASISSNGPTLSANNKLMANLDSIRTNKEEKFLNVQILHHKFVKIGK